MSGSDGSQGHGRSERGPIDSYLICATPRTGSSLLCGLLESTGVAGRPESYFRRQDQPSWAARWDIGRAREGAYGFADYLRAAMSAGRSENGVFAARVMWGTLEEVIDNLATVYPDVAGAGLLNRAFGFTRFVHLYRGDVVGQAVSWLRAEQTDVWHVVGEARSAPPPAREPRFDAGRIRDLVRTIGAHNDAWREWFSGARIRPHRVRYEDLVDDPVSVTLGILDFLGLEQPPGIEIRAGHGQLADRLNAEWIHRYRSGRGD